MECDEDGLPTDVNSENTENESYSTKDMTIFLIDNTAEMFKQRQLRTNGKNVAGTYFNLCLRICKYSLLRAVRYNPKDLFAIILFGTRSKDDGDQNPSGISTFFDIGCPNVDIIKRLHVMIEHFDYDRYVRQYGHSNDDYTIADTFWKCASIVTNSKQQKISSYSIILMTCHDNPHAGDTAKIIRAKKRALDLEALSSNLELRLLYFDDLSFDLNSFYKQILRVVNNNNNNNDYDDYHEPLITPVNDIDELPFCVIKRENDGSRIKRSIAGLKFRLGGSLIIGVDVFGFYRRRTLPTSVKIYERDNEPVKSIREYIDSDSGQRLLSSDLNKYCVIANQSISFTKDELLKLSALSESAGLTLLGFKSMRNLTIELHFKASSFIFPSERIVRGSKLLFTELLERCISKKKFALCSFTSRYKGRPCLVALAPQSELSDKDGKQVFPAGFHLIHLPYAENIREIPVKVASVVSAEQENLFDGIVKKLTYSSYSPSLFSNPKLTNHWRNLEALQLSYEYDREQEDEESLTIIDDTSVDYDKISERLADLEDEFLTTFNLADQQPESKKRTNDSLPQQKRTIITSKMKKSNDTDEVSLERLTVVQLKNHLKERGFKVSGNYRKEDLLNMARRAFN